MIEFMEGNDAVVRGAVDAGCGFFAGYPITPATSILTGLIKELPPVGGIVVEGEDEIASIGMCIGAATAGLRAMTATSGPGISLYSENLGLCQMGETPLVVVDVQRQGPATGSATKGADSDIEFLRWVTSGGLPMVVLCPENATDCYTLTRRAFILAEELRTPVIVASQKEVGLTRERVDLEAAAQDLPSAPFPHRPADDAAYLPHDFSDPADVAPLSPIGGAHMIRYTTSMHDRRGFLTKDPDTIAEMVDHLRAKIEARADDIADVELDLQEGARTLVVSYGVTARACRGAVARVRSRGGAVSLAVVRSLFPVPEKVLKEAFAGVERLVVAEMNLGQYVEEIRRIAPDLPIVPVTKMNTDLISPGEIIEEGGLL